MTREKFYMDHYGMNYFNKYNSFALINYSKKYYGRKDSEIYCLRGSRLHFENIRFYGAEFKYKCLDGNFEPISYKYEIHPVESKSRGGRVIIFFEWRAEKKKTLSPMGYKCRFIKYNAPDFIVTLPQWFKDQCEASGVVLPNDITFCIE